MCKLLSWYSIPTSSEFCFEKYLYAGRTANQYCRTFHKTVEWLKKQYSFVAVRS